MHASVRWLNSLCTPAGLTADEIEATLTGVGFPVESREPVGDDVRLDVEVTSNRGDCLSHLGLARELCAATGRRLALPALGPAAGQAAGASASGSADARAEVGSALALRSEAGALCPRFTARVIRGVKVGPSPAWLAGALESVGQKSVNNVVDATNFINFELGNPCHAFDLRTLAGPELVVRLARAGEELITLDGRKRTLAGDEVVVADAQRARSLAGVIGGVDSGVSASTTDVVLEVATWAPAAVRRAARRHQVRTDASHRYERFVDPRTLDFAGERLAALVLAVAGGEPLRGLLSVGEPAPQARTITLRRRRVAEVTGVDVPTAEIARILALHEFACVQAGDVLTCTVPAHRHDVTREVDLVEEVARTRGLGAIPVLERVPVVVRPAQATEKARAEVARALTGMGFFETVTFSFLRPEHATPWLTGPGARAGEPAPTLINVDDERRGGEPTLRPSAIPSLLVCRKANLDGQAGASGGPVRLYEVGPTFAQSAAGSGSGAGGDARNAGSAAPRPTTIEKRTLALLLDVAPSGAKVGQPERQAGLRAVRAAVEGAARACAGPWARVRVEPCEPVCAGVRAGSCGRLIVNEQDVGWLGLVGDDALKAHGLDVALACAELDEATLLAMYPHATRIEPLPGFPCVERDLSVVLADGVRWGQVEDAVRGASPAMMEHLAFVGTFRGKQVGEGKKSVTFRMRFRAPDRTLRREDVEPQVQGVVALLAERFGAALRA